MSRNEKSKNIITNIYIVQKTIIPEDNERYTVILGVFDEEKNASLLVKTLLTEVLEDIDISCDFLSNIKELQNKITTEWKPTWAAPRFKITSHEIQKRK